ncbi:MAG: zf-TFIIB domain-containing protein [Deltaproteobacteria bacterium]|nr:zf-TFIIB domain-containing protein [Deltaproteobacteria bacterium]MBW1813555.1 zf-TFIIB domain-containing protein [Deltaproteobacteria bacterium]MBW1847319.1 zf-TFIIB domain-containing protein [Deltaproteobacteria bacterium]MBW2180023.1 zf-TFIIB domain-containing protein [Deltaproteobacteria bacterium]
MAEAHLIIRVQAEEIYFNQEEQDKIKALREKAAKEKQEQYCEEHKYHCFRCGLKSLVEVQKGNIAIDICVNENCGAVHLDPGELETILKDSGLINNVRNSILNVFK